MDAGVGKRIALWEVTWVLVGLFVLLTLDALTFERFFVVSLLGYVVALEVLVSPATRPGWRAPLWWPIYVGLLVFGVYLLERVLSAVPPNVV